MKRLALTLTAFALTGACVNTASAGDCAWATVGMVLAGLAAFQLLNRALVYGQPAPVYYVPAAPVYYTPAPVVTVRHYGGGFYQRPHLLRSW